MGTIRARALQLGRSRLFGAWAASLLARSISLAPLALLLIREDFATLPEVRIFILTFAVVGASSYSLNQVHEYKQFHAGGTGRHALLGNILQYAGVTVFSLLVLVPLIHEAPWATLLGAIAVVPQPATALYRARTVDSNERYRIAYLSTAIRDALPAAVCLHAAITATAPQHIVLAFTLGTYIQLALLHFVSRGDFPNYPTSGYKRSGIAYVLLGAVCLALYQPIARVFAESMPSDAALAQYELAERPAYTLALVLAGGVGTELQRRWTRSSARQRRRELTRILVIFAGVMIVTGSVIVIGAAALSRHFPIVDETLVSVLAIAFASNTAYLISVTLSRLTLAKGRPRASLAGYGAGLITMLIAWLILEQGESSLIIVPISVTAGYVTSIAVMSFASRRHE